ncbi:hypothetical protein [Paraburkholderia tropica]|uniref:hypothetical protein n=1 Tax=Paraburkholderia tropica TaxID=92647 RepID=UPI00162038C2|nr:hypothetical protein [Paraburkholderia tropica]MBB6320550.1 hypothetical protein [Paraburkholderia tropica]
MSERIRGQRAAIYFQPQILSGERLCAGVVIRLDDGRIATRVAIQPEEVAHAFGASGAELYAIANHLCLALVEHLQDVGSFDNWIAPFESAIIGKLGRVEGAQLETLLDAQVRQHSVLHTLLDTYEIPNVKQVDGIVRQVKRAIQKSHSPHLAERFHRELSVLSDALPLKVEFLGARYACYFIQISHSPRGIEESARRAHGKLFELQSVRTFFDGSPQDAFLDERPSQFELLVVGDQTNDLQKSAWRQIESLADASNLQTRLLADASEAARAVMRYEHAA